MRWTIYMALLLMLYAGAHAAWAQNKQAQPAADKGDPVRVYVSPSASKSVEIGDFYLRRRKYAAAVSRFQEALQTDSHYAPAYRELGRAYEKMGLWQKSLDAYRKYLDELPSAKDAREAKDIHKAIARLQQEIFAEGQSSHSQSNLK
jgi:tetratricopeptide (TPR) repeat protein